jgi:imidazolonepropionase-like amidohydrolase
MKRVLLYGAAGIASLLTAAAVAVLSVIALLQPPKLPVPPRGEFTIADVELVQPGVERRSHVDIRVRDGVLLSIRPAVNHPAGRVLSCRGCFALPGLIDMHAHLPPRALIGTERLFSLMFLANGVTTIREMGSSDGAAYAIRDEIQEGRYPGPRVISCGRVLDGDPPTRPNNVVVRTPAAGRAAVAEADRHGARCIKLYNMLRRDVVLAIAAEAGRRGLPIVAHVPHSVSITDAPYIADVAHLTGVPEVSNPQARGLDDYSNADFAALTDQRIAVVTAAALRQGTVHTPALINEESRRTLAGAGLYPPDPQLAVLPDIFDRVWRTIWHAPNVGPNQAVYERFLDRDRAAVKAFLAAGVPVFAGTDTMMPYVAPGSSLKSEVRNFAELGLSPEQALARATTAPGRFWKDRTYGRLAEGLPADIVLYRRDPTVSLDALESLQIVVADGRVYSASDLKAGMEGYRRHFHGRAYDSIMEVVFRVLRSQYDPPWDEHTAGGSADAP